MSDFDDSEYDLARAQAVGRKIKEARIAASLTQRQVLDAMDVAPDYRAWIREVEAGKRERTGVPVLLSAEQYVKIARVIDCNAADLLTAAKIPRREWPDTYGLDVTGAHTPHINAAGLTDRQLRIIEELVRELRNMNDNSTDGDDG